MWGIPMAARRTQPASYPHSPASYPHITHVIPAKAGIYAAGRDDARRLAVWGIPIDARRTQPPSYPHSPTSFPHITHVIPAKAGIYAAGRDDTGGICGMGATRRDEQTTEPRCGLCSIIGIGRVELLSRNPSS